MFNYKGADYKSKSAVVRILLEQGHSKCDISKELGITYQTVHAVLMSMSNRAEVLAKLSDGKAKEPKVRKKKTVPVEPIESDEKGTSELESSETD